jgi:hypothetical protein
MKPTSEQTRNGVLSAVPVLSEEDVLTLVSFSRQPTGLSDAVTASHPAAVDPSSAYGCVDWYLYPYSKVQSAVA